MIPFSCFFTFIPCTALLNSFHMIFTSITNKRMLPFGSFCFGFCFSFDISVVAVPHQENGLYFQFSLRKKRIVIQCDESMWVDVFVGRYFEIHFMLANIRISTFFLRKTNTTNVFSFQHISNFVHFISSVILFKKKETTISCAKSNEPTCWPLSHRRWLSLSVSILLINQSIFSEMESSIILAIRSAGNGKLPKTQWPMKNTWHRVRRACDSAVHTLRGQPWICLL